MSTDNLLPEFGPDFFAAFFNVDQHKIKEYIDKTGIHYRKLRRNDSGCEEYLFLQKVPSDNENLPYLDSMEDLAMRAMMIMIYRRKNE